jgi:hypothetical protein
VKPATLIWRGVAAGAALLVAVWLAAGLRSTILEERAEDQLREGFTLTDPTPAQARTLSRVARDLDRAGELNPDRVPDMYRAQILVVLGEREQGRRLAREVTRAEPDNLEIWRTARAIALALRDREFEDEANRRIRELNPRVSG